MESFGMAMVVEKVTSVITQPGTRVDKHLYGAHNDRPAPAWCANCREGSATRLVAQWPAFLAPMAWNLLILSLLFPSGTRFQTNNPKT